MSTDFFIYSTDAAPLTHARLHELAGKARWTLLVRLGGKEIEPSEQPLQAGAIYDVYGVKDAALLKDVRSAFAKKATGKLDKHYKTGALNSIYLRMDALKAPVDPDEYPEADGEHAETVEQSKWYFGLNGHGGPLQVDLWTTLGKALPGLIGDPQSGDVEPCGPSAKKARRKK